MNTFLNQYIQRDKLMMRDREHVAKVKKDLVGKGMSPRNALRKIKKAFSGAIREKLNRG